MIKIIPIIILTSSIIFVLSVFGAEAPTTKKEIKWQPIPGSNIPGIKPFIDVNNTTTFNDKEDRKYNVVSILFSYDFPIQMIINKKKQIIQGIVKTLLIECNSGLTAPMQDYYFVEKLPTWQTKPVGGLRYPEDISLTAFPVDTNTTLYNALCPSYI